MFHMKNVMKFSSPSQKYIFPYLIKSLSHTTPIPLLPPRPSAPSPGSPQIALLFKKYKRNACISFTHSQSIVQFKISGKCWWNSENEMSLGLVDCVWWDLALFPKCYDLQFLLYVECNIGFDSLYYFNLEMTLSLSEMPVFHFHL